MKRLTLLFLTTFYLNLFGMNPDDSKNFFRSIGKELSTISLENKMVTLKNGSQMYSNEVENTMKYIVEIVVEKENPLFFNVLVNYCHGQDLDANKQYLRQNEQYFKKSIFNSDESICNEVKNVIESITDIKKITFNSLITSPIKNDKVVKKPLPLFWRMYKITYDQEGNVSFELIQKKNNSNNNTGLK